MSFKDAAEDCIRRGRNLMRSFDASQIDQARNMSLLKSSMDSIEAATDVTLSLHVKELLLMGASWILLEVFYDHWKPVVHRIADQGRDDEEIFMEPMYNEWNDLVSDVDDLKAE